MFNMTKKTYSRVVGFIAIAMLIGFFIVVASMRNFEAFTIELESVYQFYFLLVISLLITVWFYLEEKQQTP